MRSSGPGGQSVNTTNSKAELRLKLSECAAVDSNIIVNLNREEDSLINGSSKCDSGEKDKSSNNDKFLIENDPHLNML